MSIVSIGGAQNVASGAFVVPIGSDRAVLNLPVGQVTLLFDEVAPTSQIRSTGAAAAEIQFQKMGNGGFAYFDGAVGGLKFAICAQRVISPTGTYVEVTYSVTA